MNGAVFAEVVIIGAGPAGSSLAIQLKRMGVSALLVDKNGTAGGLVENAHRIRNYLGLGGVAGKDFVRMIRQHLNSMDISVCKMDVSQISLTPDAFFELTGADHGPVRAKAVVLAVGTVPVEHEAAGEGSNIFYDLVSLQKSHIFSKSESVTVIGGGESALDYALSLAENGKNVELIIRDKSPRVSGMLLEEVKTNNRINMTCSAGAEIIQGRITGKMPVLAAIGRKSAVDRVSMDFSLPHPRVFVIGNASSNSLGQTAEACGEAINSAKRLIPAIS